MNRETVLQGRDTRCPKYSRQAVWSWKFYKAAKFYVYKVVMVETKSNPKHTLCRFEKLLCCRKIFRR